MSDMYARGQRWISTTEAQLGLGIVAEVADRTVTLSFPAAAEERTYARRDAPLTRIIYRPGDRVTHFDGESLVVIDQQQQGGLVIYLVRDESGTERVLPEIELDCFVHFNTPKERLLSGQIDPLKFFDLRYQALGHLRSWQQSGVVGLLGPRIQLLPHQLYVAHHAGNRLAPRVLLADEVGLGKTIEAGLILHQQLLGGLASRVLILVPDSLLHQWLVEMLRRFNLHFSVLDEVIASELSHDGQNPFETTQRVLCPLSFLVNHPERQQQALACVWDLLLVDEAHHLKWSREEASPEYSCVERFARIAGGVLLLTATPEQLGVEGHFARLRLLDPDRYYDFDQFVAGEERYRLVTHLVRDLVIGRLPEGLENYLGKNELAAIRAQHASGEVDAACEQAIAALLDRHGTGRVLFRNTRAAVKGFPQRIMHKVPLPFPENHAIAAPLIDWLQVEAVFGVDWINLDARVVWLKEFLKKHRNERVLLICARAETAVTLEEYLRYREGVRSAVFHEGMSLVARDRAAAFFADSEDFAQILVSSEIGSEGRNFQFARHIILFDLPLDPDLLEQRIGRLDRIGQRNEVNIHVPYYEGTRQEALLRWYHEGLNVFEETCAFGHAIFTEFGPELLAVLEQDDAGELNRLIAETACRAAQLRRALHEGRDLLLEMNSCRQPEANQIIESIRASERSADLEGFVEGFCDQLGIDIEEHSSDTVILRPTERMLSGNLPGMDEEGITATYSRDIALSREDIAFLSWEHPVVDGAIDMILSGDHGNTAIGTMRLKPLKPGTLLLEALFTVECIAPAALRLERYLPTTVVRLVVNREGKELGDLLTHEKLSSLVEPVPLATGQMLVGQAREPLEELVRHAEKIAEGKLPAMIEAARMNVIAEERVEVTRLAALAKVNPNIRPDEVTTLQECYGDLDHCLGNATVRLDAIRLVVAV
jgi:ATP-dependent helicase HepA